MKPIVTWVLLANARSGQVFENRGPGKGLNALAERTAFADVPRKHRAKAGVGHSIAGPGVSAVDQADLQKLSDALFARQLMEGLSNARANKSFDRLILIAGPHMLGLLRQELDGSMRRVLLGEIPKDLTNLPTLELENQLGELVAI